jgi:hypothetical protein
MSAIEKRGALKRGWWLGILLACVPVHQALAADGGVAPSAVEGDAPAVQAAATAAGKEMPPVFAHQARHASFGLQWASAPARQVADWIVSSGDNHDRPFAIVDKVNARVFVFHADGHLRDASAALLGAARGDDSVPGIGDRAMSSILPGERTTPAGRFVASLGRNPQGQDILWVDYDSGIAMHRVVTTNPLEHRAERLATPSVLDNRISYGCINVPAKFYEAAVVPAFTGGGGVVYVLPETRAADEVFDIHGVEP